ncbi:DUF397 domain-containing protein [Nocardiopsis gilva YIM 90087]|uniref:DUF397 domain-containing protein n=1 Tax=Nocardiopsis gilva YIM 90087 TaxID=1235441 RepID=A0A223S026_9ACTN|nr:DUF397 domain-containing protein [Nocardiopsis gilva]ASU81480.1 DUF397 domain-containing protein [Nocardiopsis gilva YIM 90087]
MHSSTALNFRKSSYSSTARDCVEVADLPSGAAVRDSKNPDKGILSFTAAEWSAFVQSTVRGEL